MLRPGPESATAANVDDSPAALPAHQLRGVLGAEETGLQVHRVDEVPIRFGDVEDGEAGESGCVVDQRVETSAALLEVSEHGRDVGDPFEVGLKQFGPATFGSGPLGLLPGFAVVDGDAKAFLRQAYGDRASDALGRAGDKNGGETHSTSLPCESKRPMVV